MDRASSPTDPGAAPSALEPTARSALAEAIASRSLAGLDGLLQVETARRIGALREAENPAQLLIAWFEGAVVDEFHAGTNLVAHARVGNADYVREVIHRPNRKYLRRPTALVEAVNDEMLIRALTPADLAVLTDIDVSDITALLTSARVPPIDVVYRMSDALGIDVTTVPPEAVDASRERDDGTGS